MLFILFLLIFSSIQNICRLSLMFFCSGRAWNIFLLGKCEIKSEKVEKIAKNGKNVEKQQFFGSSGGFFSSQKVFIGTYHHITSPHRGLGGYSSISREKVDFIQIWSPINLSGKKLAKSLTHYRVLTLLFYLILWEVDFSN